MKGDPRHRVGAHNSWANTEDRAARTSAARRGLDARFEREAREAFPDATDKAIAEAAAARRTAYYIALSAAGRAARAS